MAGASKLVELLPEGYGYVIFVAVDSILLNMWMARKVGEARKKHNVPYPIMYSPDNNEFNCVQRAHQNTLEFHPMFTTLLLLGGLQHPGVAIAGGIIYLVSRIVYARGYYTGVPKNRKKAAFGMIGMLMLMGSTLSLAVHQLGWNLPACLQRN